MSANINYLITAKNITVNYNGQTHIVSRSDDLADKLIDAIKNGKIDEIPNLVSVANRIENFGKGNFQVKDGIVYINGVAASSVLSNKIISFSNEGLPCEPLVKFAENLQKNPSFRAVNELYSFLEKNDHPITQNGCFIAYKKVCGDFLDAYSRTMDNSVGNVVSMPRNQVNDDPTQTCSYGLHVANWNYANNIYNAGTDSKMLEVEVNPADVVSVPIDYSNSKIRVCSYKVLGVVDCENSSSPLRITEEEKELQDDSCDCCDCNGCCDDCDCEDEECEYDNSEEESQCNCCITSSDGKIYYTGAFCPSHKDDEDDSYPWDDELK